jgi:hypothetical protein
MKLRRFQLEKGIGTVEIILEKRTLTQRKTARDTEPTVAEFSGSEALSRLKTFQG